MSLNVIPTLRVAAKAVVLNKEGNVLIVRESKTDKDNVKVGLWGLPGGRLEPGESFYDGLQRELKEEIGIAARPIKPLYVGEWNPVIRGIPNQIIAIFILCYAETEDIALSKEHDESAWIIPTSRGDYPMMSPDCDVIDLISASPNIIKARIN